VRRPGAPLTPPRGGRLLRIVGKASVKSREGPTTIKSWCSLLLDAHWFGIPFYPPPHANQRASHRGNPRNGSFPASVRRLFGEISDECFLYICLRPAYRCSGVYRGVVGGCWSGVVRVCHHHCGAALLVASPHEASSGRGIVSSRQCEPQLPRDRGL